MTYACTPEGRSGCADTLPAPAPRDFLSSYRPANVIESAQPQEQEVPMSDDLDLENAQPWRPMSDTGTAALSKLSGVEWVRVMITPEGSVYGDIEGDENAYEICRVCGGYERLANPPDFPIIHIHERHDHSNSDS